MKYFYDLEFLEDGETIDLISIGIVDSNGREYYAVNGDMDIDRIHRHEWLRENVVPHLPLTRGHVTFTGRDWDLDWDSGCVKDQWQIAQEVSDFLIPDEEGLQLWADYGAYDHVRLMQLWGPMIEKPEHLPMWTHDLQQYAESVCNRFEVDIQPQPRADRTAHNALHDALNNCEFFSRLRDAELFWDGGKTSHG